MITILNMEWSSFGKGLLGIMINPLFYWFVIYATLISMIRIKQERQQFGIKLTSFFAEISRTFFLSLASFSILTVVFMYLELALSIEAIILLSALTLILSSLGILSAVYTLGATFIALMSLFILEDVFTWDLLSFNIGSEAVFSALVILMAILLIIEGLAITSHMSKFPEKTKSYRGLVSGHFRLKRLIFVPFFTFVPVTESFSHIPLLPYLVTDTQTYVVLLLPFLIGLNYKVKTEYPDEAIANLRKRTLSLGFIVLVISLSSLVIPLLSIGALVTAFIGREWIVYVQNKKNFEEKNIFIPNQTGLKILSVLENSLGEELGLDTGDTILKVNFEQVYDIQSFHAALNKNIIAFKLEVENRLGQKIYVHGSLKDKEYKGFGLVFANIDARRS